MFDPDTKGRTRRLCAAIEGIYLASLARLLKGFEKADLAYLNAELRTAATIEMAARVPELESH
jgi:hypothetical protein